MSERIRNRFVAEIASWKKELGENYPLRNARLIERRIHIKSNSIDAYSHGLPLLFEYIVIVHSTIM